MSRIARQSLGVAAAMILCAPIARAQVGSVDVGITAGLNMSTISGGTASVSEKRSYRPDFKGGLSLVIPMNDAISFQPELLYSREGVKIADSGAEGTIKLNYVSVPLLLRFNLGDAKTQGRPSLYVGPYFAKKVGCNVEFKVGGISDSSECSDNAGGAVKSTDFGATVGGEIAVGPIGIFARYSMGLTSIDDTKPTPEDVKNRVISIGGRWSIGGR